METVTQKAPAKINLYLKVTERRADGYHTLDTLFLPLSCPTDQITIDFVKSGGIQIMCDSPDVPLDSKNICWKAAEHYFNKAGIAPACRITIEKEIPVAAGLGGGSSNAATVLTILNSKFKALDDAELNQIALQCGADVPFFLHRKPVFASGIGDKFEYINDFDFKRPLLLVNPSFPVSAAWAYRNLSPAKIGSVDINFRQELLKSFCEPSESISKYIFNDLAEALYMKFPLLKMLRRDMLNAGAEAVEISGSGPTLFAVCRNSGSRAAIREMLERDHQPMRIYESEVI
ncbi:MAG: 4-(cytidine 5'-diphospho)-2-C-methyl-D-erythritol kinase [Lentisphaerae bacterium]|nr:4-(cytidine 5'-diphospho)-2-C-methyl-D-erythritol kinase [Lentisphaerota bacterium]MCP4101173.1 4-(cytidine 5'-diphospho)-2-C-methyl-D-erythritol kinase [Lentisphaerota bacterium]